jgi:8-oxo-dGTP diphosphatase
VLQETKTRSAQGVVVNEKLVALLLTSDSENLTATVKITATVEDRVVRVSREVVESHGIAFDHAKMIEYAIERLRNK